MPLRRSFQDAEETLLRQPQALDETEGQTTYDLMHCYGPIHYYGLNETNDLDVLPIELRHALYCYSLAVCKPPVKRKRQQTPQHLPFLPAVHEHDFNDEFN